MYKRTHSSDRRDTENAYCGQPSQQALIAEGGLNYVLTNTGWRTGRSGWHCGQPNEHAVGGCAAHRRLVLNLVAPSFDPWCLGEFLLSLPHNDRAEIPGGEDDFAAAEGTLAAMRTDHGDVIQVHSNLGSIRSRALGPSRHCPILQTTDG
jgi:hypothetical protein